MNHFSLKARKKFPGKILIIGSDGTLGSAMKSLLRELDISAFFSTRNLQSKEADHIYLDLNNPNIDVEKFDVIVYLAQSSRYRDYPAGLGDLSQINIVAPSVISRAALRGGAKFVYFSTGSVYEPSDRCLNESSQLKRQGLLDSYSLSKLLGESQISDISSSNLVIRPFFIYGKNAKESSLFPSLVRSVLQEKEITLAGETGLVFNPISSRQAALALIHLIECDAAGTYNISGYESTHLKAVVEKISRKLNKKPTFKVLPGSSQLLGDTEKLKATGFTYSESLDEGLSNFLSEIKLP